MAELLIGLKKIAVGMSLTFEWDAAKASLNLQKHGVSFEDAIAVFADPLARIFSDEQHSQDEARELIIGHGRSRQLLVVSFTERRAAVRLISARPATRLERRDYEENSET